MAADSKTPLTPAEYAAGRQVKHNDQTVTIRGAISGDFGSRFLLASAGDSLVCGLLEESLVRDEFDAVEPETAAAPAPADTTTTPADSPATGTDGTEGTGGA